MSVQDRQYIRDIERPFEDVASEGVMADNMSDAEKLLHFSCPTQASNGKWYRTTLAVTNVPVCELYNVLSNANFIAQRLREIAKDSGPLRQLIETEAAKIDSLRQLLKRREQGEIGPIIFAESNVHSERSL